MRIKEYNVWRVLGETNEMSGIDEIPGLQCPLCDRNRYPTKLWSSYVGCDFMGNWCHLRLDERMRQRDRE